MNNDNVKIITSVKTKFENPEKLWFVGYRIDVKEVVRIRTALLEANACISGFKIVSLDHTPFIMFSTFFSAESKRHENAKLLC